MKVGVGGLINSCYHLHAAVTEPEVQSGLISLKTDDEHKREDNLLIRSAALDSGNGFYLFSCPSNDLVFNISQVT